MSASAWARCLCALAVAAFFMPGYVRAGGLNLAAVNCEKYENEVLASTAPGYNADPIDTVMWLFGFSIAKAGDRVMYGDSLKAFGFALDAECRNNPGSTLLEAVTAVKSKRENPMDLTRLDCAAFEPRHLALQKSDPESANTLTMWMFGYAVGLSGTHLLDPDNLAKFDTALTEYCAKHPQETVYDALSSANAAVPVAPGTPQHRPAR